jgi:REP element-mobilizing transposase RayT
MKPGSFSQIYIHVVITVKNRECLLGKHIRSDVFKIMGGILNEQGHKPILINGVEDHAHIFFGFNPKCSISDTVKELKRRTTLFINTKGLIRGKFNWQNGYGAFSYSRSHIGRVHNYIARQEEHHARKSFREEYIEFLSKYDIEFDKRYLFDFDN